MALNKIFSEAFVYAFANALNRGTFLVITPIMLLYFSVEDVGKVSVTYAVSQFLLPIFMLGMGAVIIREGVKSCQTNFYLTGKSIILTFFLGGATLLVAQMIEHPDYWYVKYAVSLGTCNALLELMLSSLRATNEKKFFALLCISKSLTLISATVFSVFYQLTLTRLFESFIIGLSLLFFISMLLYRYRLYDNKSNITFSDSLKYSIFLVPHAVAVWAISSADKVVLDITSSDYDLGVYSVAYTLAMILLVINSGIALALPRYIYEDIGKFEKVSVRNKFVFLYTTLYIAVCFCIEVAIWLDSQFYNLLPTDERFIFVYRLAVIGIYFSGFYHFYSLFLMYKKHTKVLSKISLFVALNNVFFNLVFIPVFGIISAAIVTIASYLLYFFLVYKSVCGEYYPILNTTKQHFYVITSATLCVLLFNCVISLITFIN